MLLGLPSLQTSLQIALRLLYKGESEVQPTEAPFKFPGPLPSSYFSPHKSWRVPGKQLEWLSYIVFVIFSFLIGMGAIFFMCTDSDLAVRVAILCIALSIAREV